MRWDHWVDNHWVEGGTARWDHWVDKGDCEAGPWVDKEGL